MILRFLLAVARAGLFPGIVFCLINSLGNLGGFAAPYATGALEDLTGTNRTGMWAVGAIMACGAALVVLLKAAPSPQGQPRNGEYPRSQPTGY